MRKLLIITVCVLLPLMGLGQKAYKIVRFTGKLPKAQVTFKLADGYPGGSELRVQNLKTGVTERFLPGSGSLGEHSELAFYLEPGDSKRKDFFVVKDLQPVFGIDLPLKLHAVYDDQGRKTEFILKRIKR